MVILGINQVSNMLSWQHDAAAAVVVDGKIIASAEEERFNRIRHSKGFPHKAMEYCLKEAGVSEKDIDIIAVGYNPTAFLKRFRIPLAPDVLFGSIATVIFFNMRLNDLRRRTGAKVVYVDHHRAHAASAYYCAGFDEANILTIDGAGETETFTFFKGKEGKIERLWDIPLDIGFDRKSSSSIGLVYTRVTNLLGLGVNAEGKTMGLASYGKPKFDFSKILNIKNHRNYKLDRRNVTKELGHLERKNNSEPLTGDHKDIAASLQHALEESFINLAREAYEKTGIRKFALAGGVALNCNMNSKLLEQDFCDDVYIQPAANDGGISLGAALDAAAQFDKNPLHKMEHAYWGPGFTNEEIEKDLKNAKASYTYHENIEEVSAKLVVEGKIVGWFQGRMEMGPRALGNRTILADPTIEGINDKINAEVKHRELWRPFAPSVTEEDASKYFEGVDKITESPFMLHTFYVKDEYREKFPSITHVDGSSRIQTVRKDQNERYYRLIKEIEKLNGFPVVLDTSFNDKGEPIVCTPKDALRCYFSTGFDALVIGNYLLEK